MRIRLTASVLHRGMTLVEVVVVIGIISIALPALFSTLIVSTRQQVSISRINEVKNQGDSVLGTMTSRIKNDAETLCMSTDGTTCGTKLCETADGPHDMNSFIDKSGGFVRYYVNSTTQSLYEYSATANVVPVVNTKRLTNDRVKVSSFALQCQKVSETTRPIVSIQYSVLAESTGNTKAEDRATLDYSTKIAVDHIDTVALQVITDGGSSQLPPIPSDSPEPIIPPIVPSVSPSPSPIATGGTVTDDGSYRTHTFTASGTLTVLQPVTADALIVAGGGGGGYAIPGTNESGGGGGGGGVGSGAVSLTAGTTYTITVGGGGRGGLKSPETKSASGSNSSLVGGTLNEVAYGGGRGGDNRGNDDQIGGNGGNGGGGAGGWGDRPGGSATKGISLSSAGASVTYYGNAGSGGPQGNWGGGGGGAGGAASVGYGGVGYLWTLNAIRYAAGGSINQAPGGNGVAGNANTGNGGGAGAKGLSGDGSGTSGAAGGSGIVIIRYPFVTTVTPAPSSVGDCTKPNASRTGWTATADSIDSSSFASYVYDANAGSFWHTQWNGGTPPQPHRITIDMGRPLAVECLKYLPRQYHPTAGTTDNYYQNGRIASYTVYVSSTNTYTVSDRVALGTFTYNPADVDAELLVPLIPKFGQYVTLESSAAINSGPWSSAAEINLVGTGGNTTVYHTVAGHVTNASSGLAISGVSMIVEYTPSGATSTSTETVITDSAGYYSLSNTVPINTLYTVRMQTLTGGSVGKSGYFNPHLTALPERIYDAINLHHTYRHDNPVYRDSQTTDTGYERQYAGQNDCASAIAEGWNYPAERCDFKLSTIVPPTLTPTPTPTPRYTYRQTVLTRDGASAYSRICDISTTTGISCPAFGLPDPTITNLRGTGNERYSDWASTVYTLPNDAYDAPDNSGVTPALLPAGTQILITTLLSTDGTSTYTRSCPLLIPNSTSRCWPRSWAATTAAMYNLGTANFGDGSGKSYVGIDFVSYPRVYQGRLRQAFRRWFVRSDEKTYVAQQCYIRTSISDISDPINWSTECMNDSGAINVFIIRDRTAEVNSGFPEFHAAHTGVPTLSSIVYPKGSGYELLQMGLNSVGDWTWNRNAVVDPYTTGSSGFIFASPAVLNNVSTLAATSLPLNLRGVDGYVIKD